MPHVEPLALDRADIETIAAALEFYSARWSSSDFDGCPPNLADLRQKIETAVPVFPCYLLAWPGVYVEELAPVLHDPSGVDDAERNGDPLPPASYELTILQGAALSMFADRAGMVGGDVESQTLFRSDFASYIRDRSSFTEDDAAGFIDDLIADNLIAESTHAGFIRGDFVVRIAPRGLAALNAWKAKRKDDGEGSREGSGVVRKERPEGSQLQPYAAPMGKRACPVCKGSGDAGNPEIGFRVCGECHGVGTVLEMLPGHVGQLLTIALEHWEKGRASQGFALLARIVSHLGERMNDCEAVAGQGAARSSMLANGILPD